MAPVLEVRDLHTHFYTREGVVKAVNGVNLALQEERIMGLVGESGCGKTVTALSIMRLVPYPGRMVQGEIYLDGRDLLDMEGEELRQARGKDISIIFQDPISGLNPVIPIGIQVEELLTAHISISRSEAAQRALDILAQLGLPDPKRIASQYPFHLSGGMCQRVMVGIALALNPRVLIADEPTSNLDVTVQAEILYQIRRLKRERHTSIILITHDLGVIAQMADEVAIMYAGSVVEHGPVMDVFQKPSHPYTWALMNTLPRLDEEPRTLQTIPGSPPDPMNLPEECPFLPRCIKARSTCRTSPRPELQEIAPDHRVACYNPVIHDW